MCKKKREKNFGTPCEIKPGVEVKEKKKNNVDGGPVWRHERDVDKKNVESDESDRTTAKHTRRVGQFDSKATMRGRGLVSWLFGLVRWGMGVWAYVRRGARAGAGGKARSVDDDRLGKVTDDPCAS